MRGGLPEGSGFQQPLEILFRLRVRQETDRMPSVRFSARDVFFEVVGTPLKSKIPHLFSYRPLVKTVLFYQSAYEAFKPGIEKWYNLRVFIVRKECIYAKERKFFDGAGISLL